MFLQQCHGFLSLGQMGSMQGHDLHWLPLLGLCLTWGCCSLSWKGLQGQSVSREQHRGSGSVCECHKVPTSFHGLQQSRDWRTRGTWGLLSWEFPRFTRHYEEVNLLKSSPRKELRDALISVCAGQFMGSLASAIY